MRGLREFERLWWCVLVSMSLGLAGCVSSPLTSAADQANKQAEAQGSPFRWKAQPVAGGSMLVKILADLPSGPSRADAVVKHDTLELIADAELAAGRSQPQIDDVKLLANGKEVWLLKTETDGIAYVVDFRPSAAGGVDIGLSKPQRYIKDRS